MCFQKRKLCGKPITNYQHFIIFNGGLWYKTHVVLIHISLLIGEVEYLFMLLLFIWSSSLKNVYVHSWVIFYYIYVSQVSYPFICWWTSMLLPCPSYYKQCCDEHLGTCVFQFWFPQCVCPAVGLLGHTAGRSV